MAITFASIGASPLSWLNQRDGGLRRRPLVATGDFAERMSIQNRDIPGFHVSETLDARGQDGMAMTAAAVSAEGDIPRPPNTSSDCDQAQRL